MSRYSKPKRRNIQMDAIQEHWEVINKLMSKISRKVPGYCETRTSDSYNLPLVLAFSLLDEVLSERQQSGDFPSTTNQIGARMFASKEILPWVDFCLVDEGRNARNDLAHKGQMVTEANCRIYVAAIEQELIVWGGL